MRPACWAARVRGVMLAVLCQAALVTLTMLAATSGFAADSRELTNLDFEQGVADSLPPGWRVASALSHGFRVSLVEARPHGGRRAALIERDARPSGSELGAISKKIDARPYRGKRIRVSAWLRYQGGWPRGWAGAFLHVYRVGGQDGFANTTEDNPAAADVWTQREIIGEVAPDADSVAFGAMFSNGGRAYVDDVEFSVLGEIGDGDVGARPLSGTGLANLRAFARLFGYVRHFHPSDGAREVDWGQFAIAGAEHVERARSPKALADSLRDVFAPIAPTIRISTRRLFPLATSSLAPTGSQPRWITSRWHLGWNGDREGSPYDPYHDRWPRSAVGSASDSVAAIGSEINVPLGSGVWCSVPLSLYADSLGTIPHVSPSQLQPERPKGWRPSGSDRGTRLAGVILFWSVAQHFYPYFAECGDNWERELVPALRRAATDRDGIEYEHTLLKLVARLHDGHGSVESPLARYLMPMRWQFVGKHLIVSQVDSGGVGRIQSGDEVLAIGGRSTAERVREVQPLVSAASNGAAREALCGWLQWSYRPDSVRLDIRRPNGERYAQLVPRRASFWPMLVRPDSVATIAPGIVYVDLHRISAADFELALPKLTDAKGVVFDLRDYPWRLGGSTAVLSHLTDTTITSAKWLIPVVTTPDHKRPEFARSSWPVVPTLPRIRGHVAFLIGPRSVSAAETQLAIVEAYHLADLVGEPSAGMNGNVAFADLPGGYRVRFTGMKVLKPDGSRHYGIGIRPTIQAVATARGIAGNRDEQLEAAIDAVSQRSQ